MNNQTNVVLVLMIRSEKLTYSFPLSIITHFLSFNKYINVQNINCYMIYSKSADSVILLFSISFSFFSSNYGTNSSVL